MAPDQRHRLSTDTDNGMVVIISGPSGAGKTTITRGVERSIPGAVFSVSWTTRPPTPADVDGVDYHFVSDEQFEEMRAHDGFLESAGVYGKKYGTPKAWVMEQLTRGRLVILEIDVQGAAAVKRQIPSAFGLFILPPSEEALLSRLRARKRESEELIQKRFGQARNEIDAARASGVYDAFLVNDDVQRAIGEAVAAVQKRRQGRGS